MRLSAVAAGTLTAVALLGAADARADLPRAPPAPKAIPGGTLPRAFTAERHDDDGDHWATVRTADGGRTCLRVVPPGQPLGPRGFNDRVVVPARDAVVLVRTELLRLDDARNAHLERLDFWFDPRTLGAREVLRSAVELRPVATHSSGLMAYGYREGEAWHLLVPIQGRASAEDDLGSSTSSGCGHAHVVVDAAAPGGGGTATVTASVSPQLVPGGGTFRLVASASRGSRDPQALLGAHLRVTGADGADSASGAAEEGDEATLE